MVNHTSFLLLDHFFREIDGRVRDKIFMSSPVPLLVASACYFVFTVWFKIFMQNNPRYVVKSKVPLITMYSCMIVVSVHLFWRIARYMIWSNYNFRCMAVDMSTTQPEVLDVVSVCHEYMILKMCYFLETALFTLNGQFKLITKYIVVHHATYPFIIWNAAAYAPGGNSLFLGAVNLLAHVVILSYLIVTITFPRLKPSWSTKFFVWLHLIQFGAAILHGAQLYFDNFCGFPLSVLTVGEVWGVLILLMFLADWLPHFSRQQMRRRVEKVIKTN